MKEHVHGVVAVRCGHTTCARGIPIIDLRSFGQGHALEAAETINAPQKYG